MANQTPDLAAVVARLEKVERQNRRLRLAGVAVLLIGVAGLLMGQGKGTAPAKILEAEQFILRGPDGSSMAELRVGPDKLPVLMLYRPGAAPGAVLMPGRFILKDDEQKGTIDLEAKDRSARPGFKTWVNLSLQSEAAKSLVSLSVVSHEKSDMAGVTVSDADGAWSGLDGRYLYFRDQNAKMRAMLGLGREGAPTLTFVDPDLRKRVVAQ